MTPQADHAARVWTVRVAGPERHDGESPYCYAIDADTLSDAKQRAWLTHLWIETSEHGTVAADGTAPNRPADHTAPGSARYGVDVVVIDCPAYPCHAGTPFGCGDPGHDWPVPARPACRCPWSWHRLRWAEGQPPISLDRLAALGYRIHRPPPEEHTW